MGLHINKSVVAATTAVGAIGGAFFDLGDAFEQAFDGAGEDFQEIFGEAVEGKDFDADELSNYAEKGLKTATKSIESSLIDKLKDNPDELKSITEENTKIVLDELKELDPFNTANMDPEIVKELKPEELEMNKIALEKQDSILESYAEEVAKANENPPNRLVSAGVGAGIGGLSGAAASAVAGSGDQPTARSAPTTSRGVTSAYRSQQASAQASESAPPSSWVDKINTDRAAARSSPLQP